MLWLADALPAKARAAMADYALHTALAEIWAVVAEANRYFASQEPWVLRKSDPAAWPRCSTSRPRFLRAVGILAQPFVPGAAAKLLDLAGGALPSDANAVAMSGRTHRLAAGTAPSAT